MLFASFSRKRRILPIEGFLEATLQWTGSVPERSKKRFSGKQEVRFYAQWESGGMPEFNFRLQSLIVAT
jgi:hypothetical protein